MSKPVVLVCGFGRCGSSLVMQMLQAGGFPVPGAWPAFEDLPARAMRGGLVGLEAYQGKAVKLLDVHRVTPSPGPLYRAIWMHRDFREQAKSQAKFGAVMMSLPDDRRTRLAYAASYAEDEPRAHRALNVICGRDGWVLGSFEKTLGAPKRTADALAKLVDDVMPAGSKFDVAAAAAVVRRRSPGCYRGMLEFEMIRERECA